MLEAPRSMVSPWRSRAAQALLAPARCLGRSGRLPPPHLLLRTVFCAAASQVGRVIGEPRASTCWLHVPGPVPHACAVAGGLLGHCCA